MYQKKTSQKIHFEFLSSEPCQNNPKIVRNGKKTMKKNKRYPSRKVKNPYVCSRHHGCTLLLRYPRIPHEALPGICCLKQLNDVTVRFSPIETSSTVIVPAVIRERGDVHKYGLTAQVSNIGMLNPTCCSSSSTTTTTIFNSHPPFRSLHLSTQSALRLHFG